MQIPLFLRNDLARPKPQSTPPSPTTLRPDGSDSETERAKNIVRMDVTLGEPAQLFTVAHLTWAAAPPAARPPISLAVFIFPLLLLLLLEIVLGGSTGHGPHVLPLHYRLSELRAESRMPNREGTVYGWKMCCPLLGGNTKPPLDWITKFSVCFLRGEGSTGR